MKMTVAEKIRLLLRRKGMTMGDLAKAVGWSRQNLSNKMGRGNFTESDIERVAVALGASVEIKFTLDGEDI